MHRLAYSTLLFTVLAGCTGSDEVALGADAGATAQDAYVAVDTSADVVVEPPPPNAPGFCFRPGADRVRELFCAQNPPHIDSLASLQAALGLGLASNPTGAPSQYVGGTSVSVLLSHSTALSGRQISSLNPRALIVGFRTAIAFQRGVQQVEVAANASKGSVNLYLFTFEQACTATGCTPGDLYTSRVESNWQNVRVVDDEDLKNTPQDCRQCHARDRERPTLLMRELRAPWTHFFDGDLAQHEPGVRGAALMNDFFAAHGSESYGGIDEITIRTTIGFELEDVMPRDQPLLFDAPTIEAERWPFRDGKYASSAQPSPTWEANYEAFKRGEQLALPFVEVRASDPEKLAKLSELYRRVRIGELPPEQLPDLADIFPDDPMTRARIGLQTEPGATPVQALVQACGACHNDKLDPSISRAQFNVDLKRMSRAELDKAIERIERSGDGVMPPVEARQLDADAKRALVAYLRAGVISSADDAFLKHAAQEGMARPAATLP